MHADRTGSAGYARPQHEADEGFSLLEVLVSLVLLSLILAMVPNTLRLARHAWQAGDRLADASSLDAVGARIEQAIAATVPVYETNDRARTALAFVGTSDALSFIASAPAGDASPRLLSHRLTVEPDAGARTVRLLLTLTPATTTGNDRRAEATTHVLTTGLDQFAIRYFGTSGADRAGPRTWQESWQNRSRLPELIEMSIRSTTRTGGQWRRFTVAPRLRRVW